MAERGKRTPEAVKRKIRELASDGWGAADIERQLRADEKFSDLAPSSRTIRAVLNELPIEVTDPTPWRMMDADPEDAALVLPVLAEAIERRHSRKEPGLSTVEAELVIRIRRAAPEMRPHHVMMWLTNVSSGAFTVVDVQTYLAFAPWRSAEAFDRWYAVMDRTWHADPVEADRASWKSVVREAVEEMQ